MSKKDTKAWAVVATWQRYSLHRLRADAEEALTAWRDKYREAGWAVKGSKSTGYTARFGAVGHSARIIKLADHPVCYIGVVEHDVEVLRAMESDQNPAFEQYSDRAKAISEGWEQVEAV